MDADDRLDVMIKIAEAVALSLDDVVRVMARADQSTFDELSANPDLLPRYIQSSVKP
jgi:hypothetical protein